MEQEKTEKLHILAVLEDGSVLNAHGILAKLNIGFGLNPLLNALRKNLYVCKKQGLVERVDKLGGSYRYRITEKGRERLGLIRAKRERLQEKPIIVLEKPIEVKSAGPSLQEQTMTIIAMKSWQQSQRKNDILWTSLKWRSEEEDHAFLLWRLEQEVEEKERYKRLYGGVNEEMQKLRRQVVEIKDNIPRLRKEYFELGRTFGKLEAQSEQLRSEGKSITSLLQDRLERKRKEKEHSHAILFRRALNKRWWNLLP